jgi:PIN domain
MSQPSPKPLRTNYVLIDFENVQPDSLEQLDYYYIKLLVFVGARQEKVPYDVAASLQRFGDRMEYIKISGNGSNALDFHIAYYIGRLAAVDPTAYFHIISKDTGFDPLIQHLRKKVFVDRAKTILDIPIVKASNCKSVAERIEVIVEKLKQLKAARPGTVKALGSTIAALFQRQLSDKEVSGLINQMAKNGYLIVSGTKITYALPSGG